MEKKYQKRLNSYNQVNKIFASVLLAYLKSINLFLFLKIWCYLIKSAKFHIFKLSFLISLKKICNSVYQKKKKLYNDTNIFYNVKLL